ncbi:MAG TPA: RNA polymerase sigma factor [Clostridiaceae bacterium]|nr:RNA polymerase sigma factor [Clostridiaceae bacterium]
MTEEMRDTILKLRQGDSGAFRLLFDAYADKALRFASAYVRNSDLAKDIVQETFIRVYRNIGTFDVEKPFEPWFYRILTNECLRYLGRGKVVEVPLESVENQMAYAGNTAYDIEEAGTLTEIIGNLEDMYRIPLILMYLEGFTEQEVAKILDLNVNTVKSRLYKTRQRLREALAREEGEGTDGR